MSDEYDNNKTYQAQSSETMGGSAPTSPDMDYVRPAEIPDQELYHGHSFITKWVFCQDAKVIGVQYFLTAVFTGIVGLILSWLMRLQLGFPEAAGFMISASETTVLGFSLSGSTIDGCGTMIELELDGDASGLSGIIISDASAGEIAFSYFEGGGDTGPCCGDGECNGDETSDSCPEDCGDPMMYASVQVIHNSPSPTVDVYVDGALAIEDFAFRMATPVISLPTSCTVGIAPADGDVIAEFPFELMEGGEYVIPKHIVKAKGTEFFD